jgi:superfamily I DNA and RNA helicase
VSVEVIRGTTAKSAAAGALVRAIRSRDDFRGRLFIGYPILRTPRGRHPVDALLVSDRHGVVAFDLIESDSISGFQQRQDDTANNLEAKLRTYRELMKGRRLRVQIGTISFAPRANPGLSHDPEIGEYRVANESGLHAVLDSFQWRERDDGVFRAVLSVLENIATIRKPPRGRKITKDDSRGSKLGRLEDTMATLDATQSRAVIESIEGIQRIRGLAGSGKTIVLARKAAYLHAQNPEWRIAVTFNTRSLKGFFTRLIREVHLLETGEPPDWNQLQVMNAWGAPGGEERRGVYHEFCASQGLPYYDYMNAKGKFGPNDTFAKVCTEALSGRRAPRPLFDAILIDEAQDLPPSFLRLCYAILTEPRRLIYAYDELQNLSRDPLPSPKTIFGDDASWNGEVARQDFILEKCYRNSRPILTTAHALGFGVYRETNPDTGLGLVQMFDNPQLWGDVGYRVTSGRLMGGESVALKRTSRTSPRFLEDHSGVDDIVQFKAFGTEDEQTEWVVRQVKDDMENDDLAAEDIMVINPDPVTTRGKVGLIRRRLLESGVPNHLAGVDTEADEFIRRGSVTFTGVHRAKGNEVGMVYVVNAHDCWSSRYNLARVRNRLFTAITRTKAWVRVCGVGRKMERLSEEYQMLRANDFELRFPYPTQDELERLRIVHRDVTAEEVGRVEGHGQHLEALIADWESKNIYLEDIDNAVVEKLREFLVVRESRSGESDT